MLQEETGQEKNAHWKFGKKKCPVVRMFKNTNNTPALLWGLNMHLFFSYNLFMLVLFWFLIFTIFEGNYLLISDQWMNLYLLKKIHQLQYWVRRYLNIS